jgi:hypothetical protein
MLHQQCVAHSHKCCNDTSSIQFGRLAQTIQLVLRRCRHTSVRTFESTPSRLPTASDSDTAAMEAATTRVLHRRAIRPAGQHPRRFVVAVTLVWFDTWPAVQLPAPVKRVRIAAAPLK